MDGILIVVGVMWLLYYIIKELSWRTNAYNKKNTMYQRLLMMLVLKE